MVQSHKESEVNLTMKKYMMKCSCGDEMNMDAMTIEEAIGKFKAMMTVEMVAKHFADKHAGDVVPPQDQVMKMIEETTKEMSM